MFYDTVGNRVRGKIVSLLSAAGSMSTAELMDELGIDRSYVIKHLNELESQGLVVADTPPGQRRGRMLRWSVDAARRDALLSEFAAFIRGTTDS